MRHDVYMFSANECLRTVSKFSPKTCKHFTFKHLNVNIFSDRIPIKVFFPHSKGTRKFQVISDFVCDTIINSRLKQTAKWDREREEKAWVYLSTEKSLQNCIWSSMSFGALVSFNSAIYPRYESNDTLFDVYKVYYWQQICLCVFFYLYHYYSMMRICERKEKEHSSLLTFHSSMIFHLHPLLCSICIQ